MTTFDIWLFGFGVGWFSGALLAAILAAWIGAPTIKVWNSNDAWNDCIRKAADRQGKS